MSHVRPPQASRCDPLPAESEPMAICHCDKSCCESQLKAAASVMVRRPTTNLRYRVYGSRCNSVHLLFVCEKRQRHAPFFVARF